MIDRSEANRALAKVLAYKGVGKRAEAQEWTERLLSILGYGKGEAIRVLSGREEEE